MKTLNTIEQLQAEINACIIRSRYYFNSNLFASYTREINDATAYEKQLKDLQRDEHLNNDAQDLCREFRL